MEETVNFTNMNGLVPQGNHICKLIDAERRRTRKDDPMYVLTLRIMEGDCQNKRLYMNVPIMPTTMWKLRQVLIALGEEVPEKGEFTFDFEELINRYCIAVVTHQTYEGKERENVNEIRAVDPAVLEDSLEKELSF